MIEFYPSPALLRDLYARMLLTRVVDDGAQRLYEQGYTDFVASCRGHEAVQVGSAACIELGKDFILPYYRDLGVVLALGMTPYEVFRTYLSHGGKSAPRLEHSHENKGAMLHWGYYKYNTITGPAPVATQLLHAAGIGFASKMRKADIVTVGYCGDGATVEPDFVEAIRFAAQHQLPVVFICEQASSDQHVDASTVYLDEQMLPAGLTYQRIDGSDIVAVYSAMCFAMQHAREGQGPVLLEMHITRSLPTFGPFEKPLVCQYDTQEIRVSDPLQQAEWYLRKRGLWDDEWASHLLARISTDVERALQDALCDIFPPQEKAEQQYDIFTPRTH